MEDYSLLTFPLWILFPWLKISRISISRFSKLDVKCNWLRPKFRSSRQRSSRSILVILSPPLPKKDQASRRNSINNKTENETREESSILYAIRFINRSSDSIHVCRNVDFLHEFLPKTGTHRWQFQLKKGYVHARFIILDCPRSPPFFTIHLFLPSIDRLFSHFFFLFFISSLSLLNFSERTHSCRFDLTPVQSSPLIVLRV